ncbi:MAG: MATE family efflux transporter [Turicibacter sp.]|nr:MATE family efflux transporter [Turicibacter sp.]
MSKNVKDMTVGNPGKLILGFAAPLFLGNIFQQLYNLADTMAVGHLLGDDALGAMGATQSLYFLLIAFVTGFSAGFAMIIGRLFGAKEGEELKKATATALVIGTVSTAILTVVGLIIAAPLLRVLNTPAEIIPEALIYIRIMYGFMLFTLYYNLLAGILQALGNSLMPLVFLIVTVILNIGLNLVMVSPQMLDMGIAGSAFGTVISQGIAAICCGIYIIKKVPMLHLKAHHFKLDFKLVKEMFLMGMSIGFGNSVIAIGSVILQTAINNLGVATITAFTTARRIFGMAFVPLMTISNAIGTYTSQNMGAQKEERIKEGIQTSIKMSFIWSTAIIIAVFTVGDQLIRFITGTQNETIVAEAVHYLQISFPFYYALSLLLIFKSVFSGVGNKSLPVWTGVIELGSKIVATLFLVPFAGLTGIAFAEPIAWVLCSILLVPTFYRRELPKISLNRQLGRKNLA